MGLLYRRVTCQSEQERMGDDSSEMDSEVKCAQEESELFSAVFGASDTEEEGMDPDSSETDSGIAGTQEHVGLLSAVFGASNTDQGSEDDTFMAEEDNFESHETHVWEKVEEVEGLWHCSHFVPAEQQSSLLRAINEEEWFSNPLNNQALRFGNLPGWATELSALIRSSIDDQILPRTIKPDRPSICEGPNVSRGVTSPLPAHILNREPLFDQMIVNSYQPTEGISAHVDLLRFEDGIAILSLESTCVMSFRSVDDSSDRCQDTGRMEYTSNAHCDSSIGEGISICGPAERSDSRGNSIKQRETSEILQPLSPMSKSHVSVRHSATRIDDRRVDLLLNPGDLIIAHGPARYNWTHEISRDNDHQVWQEQPVLQQHRVSVTLRRLCSEAQ